MENYKKLIELITGLENDINKVVNKGQSSAAVRVRSQLQEIRILAKELRQDIQDTLKEHETRKLNNQ